MEAAGQHKNIQFTWVGLCKLARTSTPPGELNIFFMGEDMDQLFSEINKWHGAAFPGCSIHRMMKKVVEEHGEFVEAVGHGNMENVSDELADCFITLVSAAGILGIDIEKTISTKFERVKRKYPTK